MKIALTEELELLVKEKVRSGRYADESDVVRDALRALKLRDDYESPPLQAALLKARAALIGPTAKSLCGRFEKTLGALDYRLSATASL